MLFPSNAARTLNNFKKFITFNIEEYNEKLKKNIVNDENMIL